MCSCAPRCQPSLIDSCLHDAGPYRHADPFSADQARACRAQDSKPAPDTFPCSLSEGRTTRLVGSGRVPPPAPRPLGCRTQTLALILEEAAVVHPAIVLAVTLVNGDAVDSEERPGSGAGVRP